MESESHLSGPTWWAIRATKVALRNKRVNFDRWQKNNRTEYRAFLSSSFKDQPLMIWLKHRPLLQIMGWSILSKNINGRSLIKAWWFSEYTVFETAHKVKVLTQIRSLFCAMRILVLSIFFFNYRCHNNSFIKGRKKSQITNFSSFLTKKWRPSWILKSFSIFFKRHN